jgi:hypothetical protein
MHVCSNCTSHFTLVLLQRALYAKTEACVVLACRRSGAVAAWHCQQAAHLSDWLVPASRKSFHCSLPPPGKSHSLTCVCAVAEQSPHVMYNSCERSIVRDPFIFLTHSWELRSVQHVAGILNFPKLPKLPIKDLEVHTTACFRLMRYEL